MAIEYKTNTVKVDLASYVHYWRGVKKIGKTTFFRDLINELYKGDLSKGLLISCGNENGFGALDNLNYIVAEEWDKLDEIVEDLISKKQELPFEFLCFDTVDELIKIAQNEIIRQHRREKGTKPSGFNGCFGGYGEPKRRLQVLIDDIMTRLKRAGYGLIWIGHTKIRDIKEKDGTEYSQLTSNLTSDYDLIFSAKADVNTIMSVEKEISDNQIKDTKRYIWFRSDGFVDAGCRFSQIEEKIDMSANDYIKALEEAIKESLQKEMTDKEIKDQKKKEKTAKENFYKENKASITSSPEKLIEQIKELLSNVPNDKKTVVSAAFKEMGVSLKDSDPKLLVQALDYLKAMK